MNLLVETHVVVNAHCWITLNFRTASLAKKHRKLASPNLRKLFERRVLRLPKSIFYGTATPMICKTPIYE